ncbi:uncharacterized protein SPPG_08248 [Spizellomyces punctatus DAOM BR117]|uniref:F-box domain-containing protein n=1 Tax=Spizellomyces punctatus (strain DAOM BR117) TaxID=645134 RepID=A0A0L0H546_SPIPD|nr:uncharacterized protein SPPG_08248 [Spizellomyces punctatus DAOM BR117]KNC96347.1 hypothetical protein SPPG_08248 [Spizellomyces punctatus DAOM BR117]|eukprot:XP_016604387.1 hypothetical protein SPPG_08248 [Spizellomyces punctatus DAOM BR117]
MSSTANLAVPGLSDDIWLLILQYLAAQDIVSLLRVSEVSRRFNGLANTNQCWYAAYTCQYAMLTNGECYTYRSNRAGPPPDWKSKFLTAYKSVENWKAYGEALEKFYLQRESVLNPGRDRMKGEDLGGEEGEISGDAPLLHSEGTSDHAELTESTPSKPSVVCISHVPWANGLQKPWEYCLSQAEATQILRDLHATDTLASTFTSMVPDHSFELSQSPTTLLGISTLHFSSSNDDLRSTILFYDIATRSLQSHLTLAVPLGLDSVPVLHHLDIQNDVFLVVDEDYPERTWQRLQFRKYSTQELIWETSVEGVMQGQRVLPYPLAKEPGRMLVLGWKVGEERLTMGVGVLFDVVRREVIRRVSYGQDVLCIAEGDPYIPCVVLTGHRDNRICIWDLETGALKGTLLGHNCPVWGFAFMDEPDDRDEKGAWRRPQALTLVSVGDTGSDSDTAEVIVWDIDRVLSHPNLNPPILTRHTIKLTTPSDVISSFYVIHPIMYTLSYFGRFGVHDLQTGKMICSVEGVADLDAVSQSSPFGFFNVHRVGQVGCGGPQIVVLTRSGVLKVWSPGVDG